MRRPRLGLEALEARDVPAYWIGDVSTDAHDPANWLDGALPTVDAWFYGPGIELTDMDPVTNEMRVRYPGGDCVGFDWDVHHVFVGYGYSGTITLGSNDLDWEPDTPLPESPPPPTPGDPVEWDFLYVDAPLAKIDQYHPWTGATTEIVVTGEDDPYAPYYYPADFVWYDGTINSTAVPSTLVVDGATALIAATNGAVTLGSRLIFDAAAAGTIEEQLHITNPTGIDVIGGAGLAIGPSTAITSAIATLMERDTIRVGGTHSRLLTQGSATIDLGLWVNGGTVDLMRNLSLAPPVVTFRGAVRGADGAWAPGVNPTDHVAVLMTSGKLIILESVELNVSSDLEVWVKGGTLATRVNTLQADRTAYIRAKWLRVEQAGATATEIFIGDPALYPAGEDVHVYSALEVRGPGNIEWKSGTYRPLVDSRVGGTDSSLWSARGNFLISHPLNPAGVRPIIGPVARPDVPLPTAGRKYTVMNSLGGITRYPNQTAEFEPLNADWKVLPGEPNLNLPDPWYIIERK